MLKATPRYIIAAGERKTFGLFVGLYKASHCRMALVDFVAILVVFLFGTFVKGGKLGNI